MKVLITVIAVAFGGYIVTADDTPYCDITIHPNGTWEPNGWRIGNQPDCTFPEWGTFHSDGTWE